MKKRLFVSGSRFYNGGKEMIRKELIVLKDSVGVLVGDCYGVDLFFISVIDQEIMLALSHIKFKVIDILIKTW